MDKNETAIEEGMDKMAFCLNTSNFTGCELPLLMLGFTPTWEIAVMAVLHAVVMAVAIAGNTMVILVVAKNQRMRTTTNFYLVNLAFCDLCVTLTSTWMNFVDFVNNRTWVLGGFLCKAFVFFQVLFLVASVLTLLLIAGDRFFGVVFALKARITERKAIPFLLTVWIISVAVSIPVFVFRIYGEKKWKNYVDKFCVDDWPSVETRRIYYTLIVVVLFILPICFMAVTYFSVMRTLRISDIPGEQIPSDVNMQKRVKRKIIMMLIVILMLFIICWLPWIVCVIYSEYFHDETEYELPPSFTKFQELARFLSYANSALNPIVYAGFNQNFKRGFKELLTRKKPRGGTSLTLRRESSHSNSYQSNTMMSKV